MADEYTRAHVQRRQGRYAGPPGTHCVTARVSARFWRERHEMNQLFEVMQSADVVIGVGSRFSMGNPAGEASTLININC